ncbi:MAG: twin-arginine translocase TatA/TatE family subunit [Methanobacterium sp.]|uniref:Sec-independent protein translocase subunit TatA/TatB n=1 Tax=Methanobacterium sp. TaxID=2164 RepID=UPI003D64610D|nr:twin-arginine translocase TatA/TatE family subunit [Methanobacterium sp.]
MIGGLGMPELLIILFVILLLFGSKKLPELAKGMGKAFGEFKRTQRESEFKIKEEPKEAEVIEKKEEIKTESKEETVQTTKTAEKSETKA